MTDFKKLTLGDAGTIRPYFDFAPGRSSDNTAGIALMWRDYYKTEFCVTADTLLLKTVYTGGRTAFLMPVGKNVGAALDFLDGYCASRGIPLLFYCAGEGDLEILRGRYVLDEKPEREWYDYLYLAEDLAFLKGKKYNGQRNHINRLTEDFPSWSFLPAGGENLERTLEFCRRMQEGSQEGSGMFLEGQRKTLEILENPGAYGTWAGALEAGGEIRGFAAGEAKGDTVYVHAELADHSFRGAYQMTVRELSRHFYDEGIKYVNREDDVGEEGLRTSKLSYHPVSLIEKTLAEAKRR